LLSVWLAVAIGATRLREARTIFVSALAIVPIVTFNQQILTAKSLQPIHYQVFIGNYVAAMALVLAVSIFWRKYAPGNKRIFTGIAIALGLTASFWGLIECHYTVRVLDAANNARDEALQVAQRINEMESSKPTHGTVYSLGLIEADDFPTVSSLPVLWARHQHIFAGLSWQENKERYYRYLYFRDLDADWLQRSIKDGDFVSMIALFGWGRHTDRLSAEAKGLTFGEIDIEAEKFGEFIKEFDFETASQPEIAYVITRREEEETLSNFDHWYERDAGEILGRYVIYRAKLRRRQ